MAVKKKVVVKKQQGSNTEILEMSITPDYVPHWTISSALREFLQNSLDAQTQGFQMEIGENETHTLITNWGTDLPLRTLLLGMTTKKDSEDEIGQFGEGYKLACLVLVREGVEVVISSPSGTISPIISFSEKYNTDILNFIWEKDKIFRGGVQIALSKKDVSVSWIRSLFLTEEPREVRILKDRPGRIYSGGLHLDLSNTSSSGKKLEDLYHWGYNLHPSKLKLDRDRKMIDQHSLSQALINCLEEHATPKEIYGALEAPYPEFKRTNSYDYRHKTSDKLLEVFYETHGNKAYPIEIAEDEETHRIIERAGFIPVEITSQILYNLLSNVAPNFDDLHDIIKRKGGDRTDYSPDKFERKRLKDALNIISQVEATYNHSVLNYFKETKIKTVNFFESRKFGEYDGAADTIYISAKILHSTGKILMLLIHEICHSEHGDHGPSFYQKVENITADMFEFLYIESL